MLLCGCFHGAISSLWSVWRCTRYLPYESRICSCSNVSSWLVADLLSPGRGCALRSEVESDVCAHVGELPCCWTMESEPTTWMAIRENPSFIWWKSSESPWLGMGSVEHAHPEWAARPHQARHWCDQHQWNGLASPAFIQNILVYHNLLVVYLCAPIQRARAYWRLRKITRACNNASPFLLLQN